MAFSFYDTKSRTKRVFEPLREGKISLYVCGVTVYDRCHVGHGRSLIFFDTVVRYLRWRGYEVEFVRNVTDIDDKIINRAHETGEAWEELVGRHIEALHRDVAALGCIQPDIEPRATEHIPEMLELIGQLEERGLAYDAGGGDIYFPVADYKDYGSLSGRVLEEEQAGARVEVDERKRNPMDFALWKSVKPGEPSWPSPWGEGRPGWHLECSAMSTKYLGQPFDIHGGGEDLIFPHHENEIAQSCGAANKVFARNWLHHAFVRIDHEKMSKSLGNIFAIEDVLKEVEAEGLRLNLLSTHYRSPLDFSPKGIAESTTAMLRVYETLTRAGDAGVVDPGYGYGRDETKGLWEAMDDDFNTPRAVAFAFDSMRDLNRALDGGDKDSAALALGQVLASGACLGLFQEDPQAFIDRYRQAQASGAGVETQEIEALIAQRNEARAAKDYAEADRIRDELAERGIVLKDGSEGTTWRPA